MVTGSNTIRTNEFPAAQWPSRVRFVQLQSIGLSLRVDVISVAVTVLITVATAAIALWSLGASTTDSPDLGFVQTFKVLIGQVSGNDADRVAEALPAVTVAILAGIALALSGAIFQTITRNPLGSPDIIGFTTGANTGALVATLVLGFGYAGTAPTIGALLGSLITGVVVYFLGMRGGTGNYRFIVVGIGISAMLVSFNGYMIATANSDNAASAAAFGMGTLADVKIGDTIPVGITMVVLIPILIALAPYMRMFELGNDSAQSKGVNTERIQLMLLIVGVGLAAAPTSVAGPIAFVALVAPQIASRITPTPGIPLVSSAVVGAALMVTCDFVARTVVEPALAVGVVTTALGGLYLLFLLVVQSRKARL